MQVRKIIRLVFIILSSRISDIQSFWFIGDDEDYSSSGDLEVVDANHTGVENDTTNGKNKDVALIDIGSTGAKNDTKQHGNKAIDAIDIISTSAENDTSHPANGGIDAIAKVNISKGKGIVLNKDETVVNTNNGDKDIIIIRKEDTWRIVANDKSEETDGTISRKVTTDRSDYNGIGKVIKPIKPDDRAKKECIKESIEVREKRASVIITAKVLNLMSDPNDNDLSIAKVQIKRVFKGSDIIHAVAEERPNMVSEDSYNKVIAIHDIGDSSICESSVNIGDTRIFMLKLEYFGNLRISSSVIRISAYSLDRTNAAVKDIPFDVEPPKKSPCVGFFCPFHANCFINDTTGSPYCGCLDDCSDYITSPVCGSDHVTYDNECLLKLQSCEWQRRIKVLHDGKCQDPCDGIKCEGQQVCKLDAEREPKCQCEASCDQTVAPVCGSDGTTYSNECMLRQKACQEDREITVMHTAECQAGNHADQIRDMFLHEDNPCTSLKCSPNRECSIDHMGVARCVCPMPCQRMMEPVCGSDGVTYENPCQLKRQNCLNGTLVTQAYTGACEPQDGCHINPCSYDEDCVVQNGVARCVCPLCKDIYYDPVCGENGISYENECMLRKENCENNKRVKVEHRGLCMLAGCEKNNTVCKFYSVCMSDGIASRCVCPDHCEKTDDPVCGTDGETYESECELRVASCKQHKDILISTFGSCVKCNSVVCKHGAKCRNGECVCPVLCPHDYEPVCGTDGRTYHNQCEMEKHGCQQNKDIDTQHTGECEEDPLESIGSGEGSGDGEDCDEMSCRFGGMCENGKCRCSFSCDAIRSPVCGSDGTTYGNQCELQMASCEQQRYISVQSQGSCDDMDEILCNGQPPVINSRNSKEYQCTKGSDCPKNSYCHIPFGKCCQEEHIEHMSDSNIRDCSESQFGCCQDGVMFAPGPNYAGCPDECQCNQVGSYGSTCNPSTKQCVCKPGVGGLRCDRCYPGYWGLHLIQLENRMGCTSCDCNEIGSERADCHQMTGRCICRPGYDGLKCGVCAGSQARIGTYGCMGGHTPSPYTTRSRKTTRHIHNSNNMPINTPKKPQATQRPPDDYNPDMKYGRIGDICLDHSYCVPHSKCRMAICHCDEGFIPTNQNTQCSAVVQSGRPEVIVPEDTDFNQCTVNPCLNRGQCVLDDNLGYRCLCPIGKTGVICKQSSYFTTPSFSGLSYLVLRSLGNITGDFYIDIAFHTMNRDGILLYASEKMDGTGQYISLVISNGQMELKFSMGKAPVQIRHPQKLSQDTYHQVIAKKQGQTAMLIVDGAEPMAAIITSSRGYLDLSGDLYLGYLPKNLTYIQEKIGVNLGFVGCIQSLTAGNMGLATVYNLEYPNPSSHIVDGLDIVACDRNPCQSIPCMNHGTCLVLGADLFECACPKGYTGSTCDLAVDLCTHSPCHESSTCNISELGEVICMCPEGRQGQFCEYEKLNEVIVPEFLGDSYMLIPLHDNMAKQMSIEVWFLTRKQNGMLLFATQFLNGEGDFFSLNIADKYLEFRFDLGDGPVFLRSMHPIKVGSWHKVLIQTKFKDGTMIVDDGEPVRGSSQEFLKELQLSGVLYLGGYKNKSNIPAESGIKMNFTGAIQRLYINGRQIENLKEEALELRHFSEYHGQPCNINPCLNGGVCVPALEKADCRCPRQYLGKNCERVAENLEMNRPVRFDGKTYLQYFNEITKMQEAQKSNKVKLKFRTHHTSGLLLYQGGGQGTSDYLIVSIVNSRVELSFTLGSWEQELFIVRSTVYVSDGVWHTVIVERDKQYASLQVDSEAPVNSTASGVSTQLDTDGMLWIGGKPNLSWLLPREYSKAFKGCIGDVYIDGVELNLFKHRHGQSNTVEFCH